MAPIVAVQRATKQLTFEGLATDFKLDAKVLKLLMDSEIADLEEFRFYFTEEKDVDLFVATDKDLKDADAKIQVARLRRAWSSVRQTAERLETKNTISTAAELDDLLSEGDLRSVKINFWKRYKLKYPADITPCDQIISRCFREVEKRLLTVYDVWKVRSLKHQVTTSRKRKQVGDGLYTFEEENYMEPNHSAGAYLARLHTYLLALAVTGAVKLPQAPNEETFGSDSVAFVAAPWDVLQAYHFRAAESAAAIPEGSRAAWLEKTDLAERAVWVSTFRDGEETIGNVIKRTMDRRGAHWDPPAAPTAESRRQQWTAAEEYGSRNHNAKPPNNAAGRDTKGKGKGAGGQFAKNNLQPGSVATSFQDGKQLCPDYQRGECKTKAMQCTKGMHKCAKVNSKGRVCGISHHGAHQCRAK